MTRREPLVRSQEELAAARLLLDGGFRAQAVSRAYYAVFRAAVVALERVGEMRSRHSGVVAAFGEVLVGQHGFDRGVGRVLQLLFEQRSRADYGYATPSAEDAATALTAAERFVDAVAAWLDQAD